MLPARLLAEPTTMPPRPAPFHCRGCRRVIGTLVGGWVVSVHDGREYQLPPGGRLQCGKCKAFTTVPAPVRGSTLDNAERA